jgi:hypothetical protein
MAIARVATPNPERPSGFLIMSSFHCRTGNSAKSLIELLGLLRDLDDQIERGDLDATVDMFARVEERLAAAARFAPTDQELFEQIGTMLTMRHKPETRRRF